MNLCGITGYLFGITKKYSTLTTKYNANKEKEVVYNGSK